MYFIYKNEYFDDVYFYIFILLLLPLVVAIMIFSLYFSYKDDEPRIRSQLLKAIGAAAIGALLIAIWITVYIECIYPYDDVYVGSGTKAESVEKETNYEKKSKT